MKPIPIKTKGERKSASNQSNRPRPTCSNKSRTKTATILFQKIPTTVMPISFAWGETLGLNSTLPIRLRDLESSSSCGNPDCLLLPTQSPRPGSKFFLQVESLIYDLSIVIPVFFIFRHTGPVKINKFSPFLIIFHFAGSGG